MNQKPKTYQNELEKPFFGPIFTISVEWNNTCHIWCITLHCISGQNIQPFWPHFGGLPLRSSLKCYFLLVWKKFEIWKLRNNYKSDVNETYMTCVPPQQLSFAKTWGCESKGGWRCIQKSTKKWWEINKISTLTSPKNSLQNDLKVGTFFHVFLNNLTLVLPKMEDGGVWLLIPLPSAHIGGGGSACC